MGFFFFWLLLCFETLAFVVGVPPFRVDEQFSRNHS